MIDFVCVTCGNDLINAINITIFSIDKLCQGEFNFHIITRKIDIDFCKELLQKINLNHKVFVHNENTIFNKNGLKLNDHRYQMILKLSAYKIINTDYFITLDSDMYLKKKFSITDFFKYNKAIMHAEPKIYHDNWWQSSGELLDFTREKHSLVGMSVTPAILSKNICQNIIETYGYKLYNRINKGWTEYTLYYLFLEKNNNLDIYHNDGTILDKYCIWELTDFDKENILKQVDNQFNSSDGIFSLVQSSLFVDKKDLYAEIMNYIKNKINSIN
jgi:hypothetical protein